MGHISRPLNSLKCPLAQPGFGTHPRHEAPGDLRVEQAHMQ